MNQGKGRKIEAVRRYVGVLGARHAPGVFRGIFRAGGRRVEEIARVRRGAVARRLQKKKRSASSAQSVQRRSPLALTARAAEVRLHAEVLLAGHLEHQIRHAVPVDVHQLDERRASGE